VHLNLLLRLMVTKIAVLDKCICRISIHFRVLYVYEIGSILSLIFCSIIIIIIIIIIWLGHTTEFQGCACQPQVKIFFLSSYLNIYFNFSFNSNNRNCNNVLVESHYKLSGMRLLTSNLILSLFFIRFIVFYRH